MSFDLPIVSAIIAGCFTLGASFITLLSTRIDSTKTIKANAELVEALSRIAITENEKNLVDRLRIKTFKKVYRKTHPENTAFVIIYFAFILALIVLISIFAVYKAAWAQWTLLFISVSFIIADICIIGKDVRKQ